MPIVVAVDGSLAADTTVGTAHMAAGREASHQGADPYYPS